MPGAIIYCRVSTKEQTQNLSLPTQLRFCREYSERQGYHVVEEFVERGESAKTTERPELQRLLSFCRENKTRVATVVVYDISRLSRQLYDHILIRTLLSKLGITLRSATQEISDSPQGKMMEGVLAVVAQFDNDVRAERTIVGMKASLERGRFPFKAPTGYLNVGEGRLEHDPERAPTIRLAFEWYATGSYSQREVLRRVTALGLTSLSGKKLCPQLFDAMLKKPIYAGRVEYMGVSSRGDFEPIVSEDLFDRVQRQLTRKGRGSTLREKDDPDFPLKRFTKCGRCGRSLTGSRSTGRGGKKYPYYHCPGCATRARKATLESKFVQLLERLQPNPAYLRLFKEIVLDAWTRSRSNSKEARRAVLKRLEGLQRRLDQLDEAHIFRRSIDQTSYERQRDKLREEVTLAELELNDARLEELDVEAVLAFAEHLLGNAARIWVEASPTQKLGFQRVLFPTGITFDGEKVGTATTCLAFNYLRPIQNQVSEMVGPPGFEPGTSRL